MKLCARCGVVKALSDFHRNALRKDGVQTFCKPCRADIDHGRYEAKVGRQVSRAEIAKCDLVCTNCHAIRTFDRNGWATRWIQEVSAMYEPASYTAA